MTQRAALLPVEEDTDLRLAELEAGFRDLTSLLALPALWSGGDAALVVGTLCEALEGLLPAELIYLREDAGGSVAVGTTVRVHGRPLADPTPQWQALLRELEGQSVAAQAYATPVGPLRVARAQMSFSHPRVTLWVGSQAADFPRPAQLACFVAAASLASTGLRTARLLAERDYAARMKDEFLAMLGHELRNPLAAISSSLGLLALKAVPEVEFERQVITRQVAQLGRLVDDLVDVARVARGKIELRLEDLSLARIVGAAVESVQPLVADKQHTLSVEVPPDLAVRGDAARLQQVIANVLGNAAKYTDPGGQIELRAARDRGGVRIRITDDGAGIEPELLPHVFEAFTQGRRAPDRAAGGLGIGLALVREIMRLHGGEVAVESPGAGRGSTFSLRLPAAPAAARPGVEPPLPAQNALRVLVVDDNVDGAQALAEILRLTGHEARVAHDATAASAVLETFAADLVLIDIGLPGIDGRALARALRRRLGASTPRLIALSGYGQPEDRARSLAAGMEQHLVKPVGLAALARALAQPPTSPRS